VVGVDDLALNLVGPSTVVSQASGNGCDITLGQCNCLSVIQRLNSSQEVQVLLDQVGQVDQVLTTVLWGRLPPCRLVGLPGSCYGNVDILLSGFVNRANNLLGGGVDNLKGLSVNTLNPFVVDEPAEAD
jgi:hypothetical protein